MKKLTKSVFIITLTAAMLFAGASCGPAANTISYPGTIGDYVHGSIPDVTVPGFTFERKLEDELVDGLFPSPTLRTKEEIQETGITAQDVLDLYNDFCRQLIFYCHEASFEKLYGSDGYSAAFGAILPDSVGSLFTIPFYYKTSSLPLDQFSRHPWFSKSDYSLYHPKYEHWRPISDVYVTRILCFFTTKKSLTKKDSIHADLIEDCAIDAEVFENMLKAFDVGTFTVTEEKVSNLQEEYSDDVNFLYNNFAEQEVYEPFCITKEVIEEANAEQLWALYHVIESLISINFYGTNLSNQAE